MFLMELLDFLDVLKQCFPAFLDKCTDGGNKDIQPFMHIFLRNRVNWFYYISLASSSCYSLWWANSLTSSTLEYSIFNWKFVPLGSLNDRKQGFNIDST